MTLDQINALSTPDFVARFGFLFENSAWIILGADRARPYASLEAMEDAVISVIGSAGPDAQLALIRAHPELGNKLAIAEDLTEASASEQASAGLDRLTAEEFDAFHALNDAYRERFGFPFIICVRKTNKAGILAAMRARTANTREQELSTALSEIAEIVRLRLQDATA